jgi:hypothetical protein
MGRDDVAEKFAETVSSFSDKMNFRHFAATFKDVVET